MTSNSKRSQDSMDTTDATPAPQGEIPRYRIDSEGALQAYESGMVVTYPDHLFTLRAVREEFAEKWTEAMTQLRGERESRKQAEAAGLLKTGDTVFVRKHPEIVSRVVRVIERYELSGGSVFDRDELALSKPVQEPAERTGSDMKCRCGKDIWGEGYDPKTGRRFYSHVDDNVGKHADGTWVEPAERERGK
jgi:hypothetical protein